MARISDQIEQLLLEMLEEHNGLWEFSRNELAERMNCVPSQINYVLQTRFNSNLGYIIQSRRGGGGSMLIRRIEIAPDQGLLQLLQTLPSELGEHDARQLLQNLYQRKLINYREAQLMQSAMLVRSLQELSPEQINRVRAQIMRAMLLAIADNPSAEC